MKFPSYLDTCVGRLGTSSERRALRCRALRALERAGQTGEDHEALHAKALAAGLQSAEDYLEVRREPAQGHPCPRASYSSVHVLYLPKQIRQFQSGVLPAQHFPLFSHPVACFEKL